MRVVGPRRRAQRGRITGCALLILSAILLLCGAAFVLGRLVAAPDLGGPVRGPDDGDTTSAVATHLAGVIAPQFIVHSHAVVVLSEHDLTVIAINRNPDPAKFTQPEVRVRDSYILLSANTTIGPLHVVAVARVNVVLSGVSDGSAHLETDITELDGGRQTIPGFLRSAVDPRGNGALSLDTIFNDSPSMQALRQSLECVYIGADGLHLGFHRPGVKPDPTDCTPQTTVVVTPAA